MTDQTIENWLRPSDVPARPGTQKVAQAGALIALAFFGGFGGWAAFAPLESAAIATGQIRVESHRKTVQHLEGGIVREILVREGEHVKAGQVLMRLDAVDSNTNLTVLKDQEGILKAQLARLVAERDGAGAIRLPDELVGLKDSNPRLVEAIATQQKAFDSRRTTQRGERDIVQQQIDQLQSQITGSRAQIAALTDQLALLANETKDVAALLDSGLSTRPRLLALQRQSAALEGQRGEEQSNIAKAEQQISEAKLRMADIGNKRSDDIQTDIRDTQSKLAEVEEKMRTAGDVNARREVRAPDAGRVLSMRVFTPGGVIRPGDPVLDIVPDADLRIVEAQVKPNDIDVVRSGLRAHVVLTAYKSRTTPPLEATVTELSPDALVTQSQDHSSYYSAEVTIDQKELDSLSQQVVLYPGMPVEVMIVTGKRTMLGYLLQPMTDSFRRAFREQ